MSDSGKLVCEVGKSSENSLAVKVSVKNLNRIEVMNYLAFMVIAGVNNIMDNSKLPSANEKVRELIETSIYAAILDRIQNHARMRERLDTMPKNLKSLKLTSEETDDLIEFLESLNVEKDLIIKKEEDLN